VRLLDDGGRLMMDRDEIEDSVTLFLEDEARLTDESCYFVCKRLMEYYWDRINEEDEDDDGVDDDDEFDGENDGEGSESGQDDNVLDRGGREEASEEDVEESVEEEEGGEKVE